MPQNASLLDNGATTDLFKTKVGIVPGTFKVNTDDEGIAVGKSGMKLETHGSNIRAVWLVSKSGVKWPYVQRAPFSPDALCNITSEPQLVYQHKAGILFDSVNDRRIIMPPHPFYQPNETIVIDAAMSPNGLGWTRLEPITDVSLIRGIMDARDLRIEPVVLRLPSNLQSRQINVVAGTCAESDFQMDAAALVRTAPLSILMSYNAPDPIKSTRLLLPSHQSNRMTRQSLAPWRRHLYLMKAALLPPRLTKGPTTNTSPNRRWAWVVHLSFQATRS